MFLDFLKYLVGGVAIEWGHTRNQDVEDDPSGPNVASMVVLALEYFGSNVVRLSYGWVTVPIILLPYFASISSTMLLTHWNDKSKSISLRFGI